MTRAYEETYLKDAMNNLGDMLDYAICDLGYEPEKFYSQFLASEISELFGIGAPKFIAGLSGPELAIEVIYRTEGRRPNGEVSEEIEKSPEYWTGWVLAYYQWYTAYSFADLQKRGLTISRVLDMYSVFHEADLSKFVFAADRIVKNSESMQI